ncbi:MAG: tRNA preQ1(34) S-adenosylmethionine ribosyltransferase-isomerase QueA [Gammaproteobacteria bacterium]|nr:MAG: tRNA preQ1(34) S-adenosylmethionine ribosyltransferase-isomerase QueA [Gammaproteobacteria bacterium]
MKISQFDYHLPEKLIAQEPLSERTASRLLHFNAHATVFNDLQFTDILSLLQPNDLLVLNDTKVIPARMYGEKASGGKVEFLLERIMDSHTVLAQLKASKSPKIGAEIFFAENIKAVVHGRQDNFFVLDFDEATNVESLLEDYGRMPLPPYIQREPRKSDSERYQTVFANYKGAVAAPTAGLHFDHKILKALQQKGIQSANVTLHVGAGTFQPVREDDIKAHKIHAEKVIVAEEVCEKISVCKQQGGRVIAVGTTVTRALESAAQSGKLEPYEMDTSLFIYPGYKFNVIDALITNFHLPKSTLLMLVSAFAGYETVMSAYQHAVTEKYRFYSYGDAMFIESSC